MTGNGIPAPDEEPKGTLPEGVELTDVEDHAVTLHLAGEFVNRTSDYLSAQPGSAEEAQAERMLDSLAERVADSPKASGSVLLCLASVLVSVGRQDEVQAWFTEQAEQVAAALKAGRD
jgi:truncated hemoglobin YjbI